MCERERWERSNKGGEGVRTGLAFWLHRRSPPLPRLTAAATAEGEGAGGLLVSDAGRPRVASGERRPRALDNIYMNGSISELTEKMLQILCFPYQTSSIGKFPLFLLCLNPTFQMMLQRKSSIGIRILHFFFAIPLIQRSPKCWTAK